MYRLLEVGEFIKDGDEYYRNTYWVPCEVPYIGRAVTEDFHPVRRKVETEYMVMIVDVPEDETQPPHPYTNTVWINEDSAKLELEVARRQHPNNNIWIEEISLQ